MARRPPLIIGVKISLSPLKIRVPTVARCFDEGGINIASGGLGQTQDYQNSFAFAVLPNFVELSTKPDIQFHHVFFFFSFLTPQVASYILSGLVKIAGAAPSQVLPGGTNHTLLSIAYNTRWCRRLRSDTTYFIFLIAIHDIILEQYSEICEAKADHQTIF